MSKCATKGCPFQARRNRTHCGLHMRPLIPKQVIDSNELLSYEELAAAAHDLLWEIDSRKRRAYRMPKYNGPHIKRLRTALARAQHYLIPRE